jgi:hypothetical protein
MHAAALAAVFGVLGEEIIRVFVGYLKSYARKQLDHHPIAWKFGVKRPFIHSRDRGPGVKGQGKENLRSQIAAKSVV